MMPGHLATLADRAEHALDEITAIRGELGAIRERFDFDEIDEERLVRSASVVGTGATITFNVLEAPQRGTLYRIDHLAVGASTLLGATRLLTAFQGVSANPPNRAPADYPIGQASLGGNNRAAGIPISNPIYLSDGLSVEIAAGDNGITFFAAVFGAIVRDTPARRLAATGAID